MHTTLQAMLEQPAWQQQVRRRLAKSMGLAILLVAGILFLLELPTPMTPSVEPAIVFELQAEREPEPKPIPEIAQPEPEVPLATVFSPEVPQTLEPEEPAESADWYESLQQAAQETVSAANSVDSLHPTFDEKRRRAAINFRPSRAPYEKKIWENVETDQLGRTILVSGNCSKVIDDPSAINYDMQREFTQYIVTCSYQESPPKELPWVDDIRDRYAYLRNPDGRSYE
ncbi:MAG: hypothetical protein ACR2QT_08485 [Woeseiaceae bacterium]